MEWKINSTQQIGIITYFDQVHLVHYEINDGILTEIIPNKTGF